MKINKIGALLIWSEDHHRLAKWYLDTFDISVIEELTHPEDTGYGLAMGESYLWIGKHSEVHGKNQDPHRIMFNISVDSVSKGYEMLVSKNVECIAKPFKAPTFDSYFATFKDLDGNIFQLIGNQ